MSTSNMEELERALLDICLKYKWLPDEEKIKQARAGLLDSVDTFWASNCFNVKIDAFYKSKFVAVSFFHKPGYPHNAKFAAEAETYKDAFNILLTKIHSEVAKENNDTTDGRPSEEI